MVTWLFNVNSVVPFPVNAAYVNVSESTGSLQLVVIEKHVPLIVSSLRVWVTSKLSHIGGNVSENNSKKCKNRTEQYVYLFDQIQIIIIHTAFTYMYMWKWRVKRVKIQKVNKKKQTNKTDTETKLWRFSLKGVFNGGWTKRKANVLRNSDIYVTFFNFF